MPSPSIADKRAAFRRLHQAGCFVIPNPWNVGSARYLQGLGFKALATTSSGFAHAQGFADGEQSCDEVLAHFREIAAATDVPVNADFEGGFADDPDRMAENVTRCIATGVAGLSIEDSTGDLDQPLYDFDLALARVKAARKAIDKAGDDVVFTARTEGFIRGRPDLDETIRRLKAFADAGADCLYSPGIKSREHIEATVKAVAPKPINFLNSGAYGFTVKDLAELGVMHQRGRQAGTGGNERLHKVGPRDRRSGQVRQFCRRDVERRAQRLLSRRLPSTAQAVSSERDPITGQPVGAPVDITPAKLPGPVTLQGRYGRVEKLKAEHAAALWDAVKGHDPIWTYMSRYGPFADAVEFSTWVASRPVLEDPYSYAIIDRDNRAVGIAAMMEIRSEMRVIEVGHIVYSPALQRTPLGTEAQFLLACYAFETLGYRRYEWKCHWLNAASRRAALRYGFIFESILRQHMIAKGRNRDTAMFSMLDSEWPTRKRNFERWLSPENFTAEGRQKLGLSALNAPAPVNPARS